MNLDDRQLKIESLNNFLETEKDRVPKKVYLMAMKEFLDLITDQLIEHRADLELELDCAKKHRSLAAFQGASDELMGRANDLIWTVGATLLQIDENLKEMEAKKARLTKLM